MARIISLLLFSIVALVCTHLCSANQNAYQNNNDPCQNPSSPQYHQVIPWREDEIIDRQLYLPTYEPVNVTDNTGCVLVQILDFQAYQSGNNHISPSFSATMRGNVFNLCDGPDYTFEVSQNDDGHRLSIPSSRVQHATLEPLTLTGYYSNDMISKALTITTERALFYATSDPYLKEQQDFYYTDNNSQCKIRVRFDEFASIVYSRPFRMTATLSNGEVLSFTFPGRVAATADYYSTKSFYEQCTCANSVPVESRAAPTASRSTSTRA